MDRCSSEFTATPRRPVIILAGRPQRAKRSAWFAGRGPCTLNSMRWKRPLFALIAVVLTFALLEGALWALGVRPLLDDRDPFQGFSSAVRVFELDAGRGVWRTTPRAVAHSFNAQSFAAIKPDNGFRVFVLGGSDVYGFPWGAEVAFAKSLERALQAAYPDRRVEIVNAAAMSYGSHRLRILVHELLEYSPDLLVIASGHNEFVEQDFYRDLLARETALDPLRSLLHRWRLFSASTRLRERFARPDRGNLPAAADGGAGSVGGLLGLDVVRRYEIDVDDQGRSRARARLTGNLTAILDAADERGVPAVLCTVASNLSGWKPNASRFEVSRDVNVRRDVEQRIGAAREALAAGASDAALAAIEPARKSAPEHADVQFASGEVLQALGRRAEARQAFILARDLDAQPSRAPGSFNVAIRQLAAERGVLLVDIERSFERSAADGTMGFDLFEDYVHPTPDAHRKIALEVWRAICAARLAGPPRPSDEETFAAAVGPAPSTAPGAASPPLLFNLGVVLENQGLRARAMEQYRACLDLSPTYTAARNNLARLLALDGRLEEAASEYSRTLATDEDNLGALIGLGDVLRRLERPAEAESILTHATRDYPQSAPAWDGLGGTLARLGRHAEAESAFRRAAHLDPRSGGVRTNLGYALLFQQKLDAAEAEFRAALERAPDLATARNGRAAALTELGRLDEAAALFRQSLALDSADAFARHGLQIIEERHGSDR